MLLETSVEQCPLEATRAALGLEDASDVLWNPCATDEESDEGYRDFMCLWLCSNDNRL